MLTPTKSSVVLVAGSALTDLQGVMDRIDSLAKDMKMIPYVVILIIRNTDIIPDTVRHNSSPPVVSVLGLREAINKKRDIIWCFTKRGVPFSF
jgi:hypothetical protein